MLVVRPAASGFFGPDFFLCELSRSVFLLLFFFAFFPGQCCPYFGPVFRSPEI